MCEMITSPQNEKLKLIRRLAERRGREREGMFLTEGEDLLDAGLAAGSSPEFSLVAAGAPIAGIETDPALLAAVSTLGSGTRVIAVWALPAADSDEQARHLYLQGVADPGNVGGLIRTAAALDGARLVLGPGCADPYSPKAVRASMGSIFAAPPASGDVSETPAPRLALAAHGGDELERVLGGLDPRTICVGAERDGLDRATLTACAAKATIPVRDGAESLNVAVAAAIALYRVCSIAGPAPDRTTTGKDDHG
jgi:TrmH family RNA methyltransferase